MSNPAQLPLETAASLPPQRTRALLAKVRDLDLRAERVRLDAGRCVTFEGCVSRDQPVGALVRYRLKRCDGVTEAIELHPIEGGLELRRRTLEGAELSRQTVALEGGAMGQAVAPCLRARIDPDTAAPRDVVHFMRRVVRAACT